MKIPKTLTILGHQYKIEYDPKLHSLGGFLGEFDYKKQLITLVPDTSQSAKQEVLLHELMHAVDHYLKIGLTEQQVHTLSSGLYAVWKENKS